MQIDAKEMQNKINSLIAKREKQELTTQEIVLLNSLQEDLLDYLDNVPKKSASILTKS